MNEPCFCYETAAAFIRLAERTINPRFHWDTFKGSRGHVNELTRALWLVKFKEEERQYGLITREQWYAFKGEGT